MQPSMAPHEASHDVVGNNTVSVISVLYNLYLTLTQSPSTVSFIFPNTYRSPLIHHHI